MKETAVLSISIVTIHSSSKRLFSLILNCILASEESLSLDGGSVDVGNDDCGGFITRREDGWKTFPALITTVIWVVEDNTEGGESDKLESDKIMEHEAATVAVGSIVTHNE